MTELFSPQGSQVDDAGPLAALHALEGAEHPQDDVCRALRQFAEDLRAPVVGAHQITCSDESERECVEAFESLFVRPLLPVLKFGQQAHFRTANLGARYEWGSVPIAEDHYATSESKDAFKLLVVKLNTHVCVTDADDGPVFGRMQRYQRESSYCGAMHALIDDAQGPFLDELRELFQEGGEDRLAVIRDPERVQAHHRPLVAAVVAARLQADRIAQEVDRHTPKTPTYYLILSCVTLNRTGRDTELVVGVHVADGRDPAATRVGYSGLDADPARYVISTEGGTLRVSDTLRQTSR